MRMHVEELLSISDDDECQSNATKCEQTCVNTPGSYRCDCGRGYQLDSDGYSCAGNIY